jgi:outer membrane protein assembly factor BamB
MIFSTRNFALIAMAALGLACDNPTGVSQIVPKAGSFDLANACGSVVEAASGGIFTFSQPSTLTLRVDSRSADGAIGWSKSLPTGNNTCIGAVGSTGNLVVATSDTVFSLNAETGAIRWRFAAPSNVRMATSSTGKVFLSRDGFSKTPAMLYALAEVDGSVIWSRTVDNLGAPFVDDVRSTVYYVRRAGAVAMDAFV